MSIHAAIAVKNTDGTITARFLKRHGYPGYTGAVLVGWYTDPSAILKLTDHEALDLVMKKAVRYIQSENCVPSKTYSGKDEYLALGRTDFNTTYLYLFEQGKWFCHGINEDEPWTDLQKLYRESGAISPSKFEPDLTVWEWVKKAKDFKDSTHGMDDILLIQDVSQTQFSIARYYGGCTFNGKKYVYAYPVDCLIREDFYSWCCRKNKTVKKESGD